VSLLLLFKSSSYSIVAHRFLETEVDLDEAIKELHVLATAPALYADFLKLNAVRTLGKSLSALSLP